MSEEILLQPSFDSLTEKLDNTATYEDWLIIQEYIDKLRKENKQLKQSLNDIKEIIKRSKAMDFQKEKGILEIIDKVLGSDK